MIPYHIVHAQAHEPAKQQVVVDLLDQQSLGTDGKEHLQEQGPQDVLRRYRRPAGISVECIQLRAQRP